MHGCMHVQVTDELLVILCDVHIPEPDIIMRTVRK